MKTPRLKVNIEKRLATFSLCVQLEVSAEILVLFGPSGAGKTQTLNAISGLLTPDAGEITLDSDLFFSSTAVPGKAQTLIFLRVNAALVMFSNSMRSSLISLLR